MSVLVCLLSFVAKVLLFLLICLLAVPCVYELVHVVVSRVDVEVLLQLIRRVVLLSKYCSFAAWPDHQWVPLRSLITSYPQWAPGQLLQPRRNNNSSLRLELSTAIRRRPMKLSHRTQMDFTTGMVILSKVWRHIVVTVEQLPLLPMLNLVGRIGRVLFWVLLRSLSSHPVFKVVWTTLAVWRVSARTQSSLVCSSGLTVM